MNHKYTYIVYGCLLVISSFVMYFFSHSNSYEGAASDFWYLPIVAGIVCFLFACNVLHKTWLSKCSVVTGLIGMILLPLGYSVAILSRSANLGLEFPIVYLGGPGIIALFSISAISLLLAIIASLFAKKTSV